MTTPPNGSGRLPVAGDSPRGTTGLRRFAASRSPRAREGHPPPPSSPGPRAGALPGPPGPPGPPGERCELCGEQVPERHAHLVDTERRSIGCACTACGLLFTRPGGRYQTVPDRVRHDPAAPLTGAEWAELSIPVGIAFFFVNSALGHVVASYPSPAGVTERELDPGGLAAWDRIAAAHPLLREAAPDVEAILVVAGQPTGNQSSGGIETFLVPIDACYSLAGALRLHWRGFDGGADVRRILADFLAGIRERARPLVPPAGG